MARLGPYELIRRLGGGGMGTVWLASQNLLGNQRIVAIKTLAHGIADDPTSLRMFRDEIRISMELRNSYIVQVHDANVDQGICYFVMEAIEGVDLHKLNELLWAYGRRLPLHVAAFIIEHVLRGLDYAHHHGTSGVVHRDVSPHNVLLSTAGEVKLTDFGIARLMDEATRGDVFQGKPRYAPRERLQLRAESVVRPTVDLFAVGALFEEMVTGRQFRFGVEGLVELCNYIVHFERDPTPLPGLPTPLCELHLGLLARDPDQRIPTARAALDLLESWSEHRNAAFELREFVQWVRHETKEYLAQSQPEALGDPDEVTAVSNSGAQSLNPSTHTHANGDSTLLGHDRGDAHRHHHLTALVLALLALGVGGGGIGYSAALSCASRQTLAAPVTPTLVAQADPPQTPVSSEPLLPRQPAEAPAPAHQVQQLPPPPAATPPPEPHEPQAVPRRAALVEVTILVGDYKPSAWIRVAGKPVAIGGRQTLSLPAGRRLRVEARKREQDPWTMLGHMKLDADRSYSVILRQHDLQISTK